MSHPRATLAASMGGGAYYGNNEGGSSIADQLMQLDPAITATLQEIDANFARAHQIVTAQLLPAVKVYGQHSAKTWQSAKFWQDFFITAAHIPVKRPEDEEIHPDSDYNTHDDYEPSSTTDDHQASPSYDRSQGDDSRGSGAHDDDVDSSNDSARFFQSVKNARASSPPRLSNTSLKAVGRREERDARAAAAGGGGGGGEANESDASWAAMESPFEKLKREVKADQDASMSQAETLLAQHRANKAAREQELLAERRNNDDGQDDDSLDQDRRDLAKGIDSIKIGSTARSPAKLRAGGAGSAKLLNKVLNAEQRKADAGQRTPGKGSSTATTSARASSSRNPFDTRDPRSASTSKWDGIADLRKTPLGTSGTKPRSKKSSKKAQQQQAKANEWDSDEDDTLDWPAGMSPPVTLQFSVPQSKYAKTPAKEAAKLVMDDLLRTVEAGPATLRKERDRRAAVAAAAEAAGASPGVGGGGSSSSRARGAPRASLVGTPLKKGPLGKPPKGQGGAQKRRDSMPTPPTLTRHGIAPTGPRQSTTPLAPPGGAGGLVPGSASSAGGKRSALLMDEGEDGLDDEALDDLADLHHPASSSKTDIDALLATDPAGTRRDGSEESESESDDESDEDEDDLVGGPPASVSKLSTFSSHSGWTTSSNSSSRPNLMASLDNDTLFGVGGTGGGGGAGGAKGASSGAAGASSTAAGGSRAGNAAASSSFRVVGPQLDQTVQGGQLLADKDVTYSAPSPTPWKA